MFDIAGNQFQAWVGTGRCDASYGLVLKGDGRGNFSPLPPIATGLIPDGDIKDMKTILGPANKKFLVVSANDENLRVFSY